MRVLFRVAPAVLLTTAQGDYDAVAYQAFSVARSPAATTLFEWNSSDDIRAAEAELRRAHHLVVQDSWRPWLWLFRPAHAEQAGQKTLQLPEVDGFRFQRT